MMQTTHLMLSFEVEISCKKENGNSEEGLVYIQSRLEMSEMINKMSQLTSTSAGVVRRVVAGQMRVPVRITVPVVPAGSGVGQKVSTRPTQVEFVVGN